MRRGFAGSGSCSVLDPGRQMTNRRQLAGFPDSSTGQTGELRSNRPSPAPAHLRLGRSGSGGLDLPLARGVDEAGSQHLDWCGLRTSQRF